MLYFKGYLQRKVTREVYTILGSCPKEAQCGQDITIKHPLGVVEDVVVQVDKTFFPTNFVALKIESKIHLQQESHCSIRMKNTNSENLLSGTCTHWLLYENFMKFLPNKWKRKDDTFFLSYKPH